MSNLRGLRRSCFVVTSLSALFSSAYAQTIDIPEGTKVRVRLEQQLSSATAEEGQPVQFAVTDDVKVNDVIVVKSETVVNGTVVEAVPKRRMGRTGKLDFSIDAIVTSDGGKIPLRYTMVKKEGGSHAVRTGVITAGVAVLFWPAAPFVLLAHGKDTTFVKGTTYEVFTDAKYSVKPKSDLPHLSITGGNTAGANTSVVVTSDPAGADILIDGSFVGNTPSTIQVPAGVHMVKVSKGDLSWERNLTVQSGGTQNLVATLAEAPK